MRRPFRLPPLLPWASLVAAAAFLVFGRTWSHGFVNFDDDVYVYGNPRVLAGLSAEGIRWAFGSFAAANWHPLTWISHMADVSMFGASPGAHHLVSVAFHAANSILLLLFLSRATGATGRSAFVALLFAVHPLHAESVAWAAERKDVLCAFFFLLALLAWRRYLERPGAARYAAAAAAFALALLSKPMAVTFPFVLLLLDAWPFGRADVPLRRRLLEKAPLFLMTAASCVVTYAAQAGQGALLAAYGGGAIPFPARAGNALISVAAYLRMAAWPSGLAVLYPYPMGGISMARAAAAGAAVLAASALSLRELPRRPYLAVGWLWFLGMLVPVLGFVQVGRQAMADRYAYLPLAGVLVAFAWGAEELARRLRAPAAATAAAAAALCAAMAYVAWLQAGFWKDDRTLYARALAVTEGNWIAHYNLGLALSEEGLAAEALPHFLRVLEIQPGRPDAEYNAGSLLLSLGREDEGIVHLRKSLDLEPDRARALAELGGALARRGEGAEAERRFAGALRMRPDSPDLRNNYGVFLEDTGRAGEAAAQYREAIRLSPGSAEAYGNLGFLLGRQGRLAEGTALLREAVRLAPGNAMAHNNLAVALLQGGDPDGAAVHFREALRLSPSLAQAGKGLEEALSRGSAGR
jgi:Flp pilus assembly protein TadD